MSRENAARFPAASWAHFFRLPSRARGHWPASFGSAAFDQAPRVVEVNFRSAYDHYL